MSTSADDGMDVIRIKVTLDQRIVTRRGESASVQLGLANVRADAPDEEIRDALDTASIVYGALAERMAETIDRLRSRGASA